MLVALAVLLPGIWRYSLVDPWETHYGEVARMMLQQHDWVHMAWPQDGEGVRSTPIRPFWLMAASLRATGVATNGGYSGEMIDDGGRTMFATIRLPVRPQRDRGADADVVDARAARRSAARVARVTRRRLVSVLLPRRAAGDAGHAARRVRDGRDRDVHDGRRGWRRADPDAVDAARGAHRRAPRAVRDRRRLHRGAGDLLRRLLLARAAASRCPQHPPPRSPPSSCRR